MSGNTFIACRYLRRVIACSCLLRSAYLHFGHIVNFLVSKYLWYTNFHVFNFCGWRGPMKINPPRKFLCTVLSSRNEWKKVTIWPLSKPGEEKKHPIERIACRTCSFHRSSPATSTYGLWRFPSSFSVYFVQCFSWCCSAHATDKVTVNSNRLNYTITFIWITSCTLQAAMSSSPVYTTSCVLNTSV